MSDSAIPLSCKSCGHPTRHKRLGAQRDLNGFRHNDACEECDCTNDPAFVSPAPLCCAIVVEEGKAWICRLPESKSIHDVESGHPNAHPFSPFVEYLGAVQPHEHTDRSQFGWYRVSEVEALARYESNVKKLADFIMQNVPGEPSRSEGVCDVAIRLLASFLKPSSTVALRARLRGLAASLCEVKTKNVYAVDMSTIARVM